MQQNETTQTEQKRETTYVIVSQKDSNSIVDLERLNKAIRIDGHIGL